MTTAVLVYAGSVTERALQPLPGGRSAWEAVRDFALSVPGSAGALLLEGQRRLEPGLPRSIGRPAWSREELLREAAAFVRSLEEEGRAVEALVLLRADEPLLDPKLLERMLANYRSYRAEYSFADGYPNGLAAEILHPRVLEPIAALAAKHPGPLDRGWLFEVVQKDINAFDIETEISPRDLREFRLDLAADTKSNTLILSRLMEAGVRDAESALALIPERQELLRGLPSFVQVQVTGGCPQACRHCAWPRVGGDILSRRDEMPRPAYEELVAGLAEFSGEAVVDLSLWGEASLHSEIEALLEATLAHPGLSTILETSGLGWKPGMLERLALIAAAHPGRFEVILSLDAADESLYRRLRGEGFAEAQAAAETLLRLAPQAVHVQFLRTLDAEEGLEAFWRGWKKRTDKVIVQKPSTFAGLLPPLKVSDLSPLDRRPCWHIKRDLSVLVDGRVPLCRDCVRGEIMLGGLFAAEGGRETMAGRIAAVWAAAEPYYRMHLEASAAERAALRSGAAASPGGLSPAEASARLLPAPCAGCDEWYTYNA